MINTLRIYDELKATMEPGAARKIAEIVTWIYEDLQNIVTKTEFNELKDVVKGLADAQARTEKRVEELAQAQVRTEKRIDELAQAQVRTEKRVEELTKAQQDLVAAQIKLTEAQIRIEQQVGNLARQVGGLSERIGGSLEDLSYDVLPALLEKYCQIEAKELERKYLTLNGREIELNVFGTGIDKTSGRSLKIVGEVKTNITLKEVKHFVQVLNMVRKSLQEDIFPLVFGYRIGLDARELAKANNIRMFVTYGKEIT